MGCDRTTWNAPSRIWSADRMDRPARRDAGSSPTGRICVGRVSHACYRVAALLCPCPHTLLGEPMLYDYIIVGAGSAGAALAARRSEKPQCSLVLPESGRAFRPHGNPPKIT